MLDRSDVRIFGLLLFALVATTATYFGLSAADMEGKVLGISFSVAGPAAFFTVLILIFHVTGLFKLGLEDLRVSNRPADSFDAEEIERQLDVLVLKLNRLGRRRQELETMRDALSRGESIDQALEAGGIRRVSRPVT